MKVTKPFCIDDNLAEKLKKINASKLVNSLLKEYFFTRDNENSSKLKQKLTKKLEEKKVLLKEIREIRRKLAEILERERKVLRIYQTFPPEITKTIKERPKMTLANCKSWYDHVWKKKFPDIKWMDLKKTFEELKGGPS